MTTPLALSPAVFPKVQLTARQRACLEQIARRQTSPQRLVRRAKILLALETGTNQCQVMRQLHLNRGTVQTWRQWWLALAPNAHSAPLWNLLILFSLFFRSICPIKEIANKFNALCEWVRDVRPKLAQMEIDGGSDKALTAVIRAALTDHPRSGTPATFTAKQIVQIVAVACEDPAASGRPISHWTPREVAEEVRKRGIVETISTRSVGRFLKSGRFTAASRGVLAQRQAGGPSGICSRGGGGV
jgi:putative transposase